MANQVDQHGKVQANKPRALGKGLESLLPSRPAAATPITVAAAAAVESTGKPLEIDVELIDRNPFQTRTNFDETKLAELATSIIASGVVQPIVVRHGVNHRQDGRYTLITGERRWLASKKAGKATIPAIVREVSNLQAMEMTIVENLQRADLNPMEQAHAYVRLSRDFHMTQEQMAERTGKDRASVSNFLRLLKLPESVQRHVELGELSFGHARALCWRWSRPRRSSPPPRRCWRSICPSARPRTTSRVCSTLSPGPSQSSPQRWSTPMCARRRTPCAGASASRSPSRTRRARAA